MTATGSSKGSGIIQYNEIADAYSQYYPPGGQTNTAYDAALYEELQLRCALIDGSIDIRGKRILDLASGNGHYACKYLEWGAECVVGIDISDRSLELGRKDAERRGVPESKLKFVVGDVTDPDLMIEGAPFDVVTSCWLLNYASDAADMRRMWNFIGRHLIVGGNFIGLTIQPLLTGQPWERSMLNYTSSREGPWGRYGVGGEVIEATPSGDGYKMRVDLFLTGLETASFEVFYLNYQTFGTSCDATGLFAGLVWRDFVISEELKAIKPLGYWNAAALSPPCRVCVAQRNAR